MNIGNYLRNRCKEANSIKKYITIKINTIFLQLKEIYLIYIDFQTTQLVFSKK